MTISIRSRYNRDTVTRVAGNDGILRTSIVPRTQTDVAFRFTSYTWEDADRIDSLALYFYGDEAAWWIIADANPEILVWDEVPVGWVLRIPDA